MLFFVQLFKSPKNRPQNSTRIQVQNPESRIRAQGPQKPL